MLGKTILFIVDDIYPNVFGGMQMHSFQLLNQWLKLGEKICLYYPKQINDKVPCYFDKYVYSKQLKLVAVNKNKEYKFPWSYLLEEIRYALRVSKLIKLESNCVAYSQGLVGLFIPRQMNNNGIHVANPHGLEPFQGYFKRKIPMGVYRFLFKSIFRKASYVVSLGGKLTEIIKEQGISQEKILIMPNGIASKWLEKRTNNTENKGDGVSFLFVGRNEHRKGIHLLFSAWSQIRTNSKLTIVGPFDEVLKTQTKRNINYTGAISDADEMRAIYLQNDVLICPSLAEGMPTVILEAMACGLLIIATDVGATSEIVDNTNGYLINSDDEKSIVKAIKNVLQLDNEELIRRKQQSYNKALEYNWNHLGKKSLELIKSSCE